MYKLPHKNKYFPHLVLDFNQFGLKRKSVHIHVTDFLTTITKNRKNKRDGVMKTNTIYNSNILLIKYIS